MAGEMPSRGRGRERERKAVRDDHGIEARCRYDLAIAAVFQDEAPYLKEWIEFHRMVGVQYFVLADDRSSDDFARVLEPYIAAGEVELLALPCPAALQEQGWTTYQTAALQALCERLRGVARWVALVDIDEFIVPSGDETLPALLRDHEALGALYVRWEPFGTSYVAALGATDLLTERMRLKWRFTPGHDMLGKSIVKPHRVQSAGIHRCALVRGYDYSDTNPGMASPTARLKVHHYWSRDEDFLLRVKLPRTGRIKGWTYDAERIAFFKRLFNDVPDDTMTRFIPELRRRVFGAAAPRRPAVARRIPGGRPRTARARTRASRRR